MQFIFDDLLQTFLASFVLWYIYELRPSFSSAKLALVRQFSTNRRASWTDFFWSSSVIQDSFGSTQAVHRVDSVVWSPCSNESFAPADWEVLSENRLGSTENRLAWWFTGACIGSAELQWIAILCAADHLRCWPDADAFHYWRFIDRPPFRSSVQPIGSPESNRIVIKTISPLSLCFASFQCPDNAFKRKINWKTFFLCLLIY